MVLRYSWNREDWRVSLPPEASSVDWRSLTEVRPLRLCTMAAGYLITAGLFLGFIPICLHITNSAITIDMGPLQPVWAAFAPTLGLLIFVSLLPSVLLWIFQNFFTLYSDTWAQAHLQDWYFLFMIFFVVLVTAIGNDLSEFLRRVAAHPFSIFQLLADKLPYATHFYIHYLVLQWPMHVIHCLRPFNLLRFVGLRQIFEEEEARLLSEPEDQGYHGLGSRSARWTINAVVGIVFSTLSPPIALLAGIDSVVCYVMFGYVLVFAETKKNDLGGVFWVKQMQHMRVGLLIYCVLMVGVLAARSSDSGPALLALPTLIFICWSYLRFDGKVCMVGLPFAERAVRRAAAGALARAESKSLEQEAPEDTGEVYVQPELLEEEER
uniref:CSC1/OSCA1-like 7TM region domain-containing protein n=1 Tax=Alexandrium catenella TaxID=2925 RepID=A0A7S1LCW9_ALECA